MDHDIISREDLKRQLEKADSRKLFMMAFIFNALEKGWTVTKGDEDGHYICEWGHKNKKDFYLNNYEKTFIKQNTTIKNLLKEIYK